MKQLAILRQFDNGIIIFNYYTINNIKYLYTIYSTEFYK